MKKGIRSANGRFYARNVYVFSDVKVVSTSSIKKEHLQDAFKERLSDTLIRVAFNFWDVKPV